LSIGRLIGFLAALLIAVAGLGQPVLAEVVAPENGCCSVAPSSADDLLDQARAARNARADEVGSGTATVTGGYDPATGPVVTGCSSNPVGCAELDVVRQLDIDPADVRFTEAIRPRTGREVPICHLCQDQFRPSQFPPGVEALPNGPWGPR
jgi:hypothetical protein